MFIISTKHKLIIFLSLFYLNVNAQNKINIDTVSRIIICQSTISYPTKEVGSGISGTVMILFDVDSSCRIVNIRIEKGLGIYFDEEALKVFKKCKPIFLGTKRTCTPTFNLRQPFTFTNQDED